MLIDQMEESGYKIETEEDNDIFKVEEEQRRKKKEENENVEAVEDEEVIIRKLTLQFTIYFPRTRFQPGPRSDARRT